MRQIKFRGKNSIGDLLNGYSIGWFENSRKGLIEYKLKMK